MIVVVGYDGISDEFVTNDPGTQYGKGLRFTAAALESSLGDYESGIYEPVGDRSRVMIIVKKIH